MQDEKKENQSAEVTDTNEQVGPEENAESNSERVEKSNRSRVPLYLKNSRSAAQGNQQDEKDETVE